MLSFLRSYKFFSKYNKIIHPIAAKRLKEYQTYSKRINKLTIKANARAALEKNRFDMAVSSVCLLYPNINTAMAADVVFSFQVLLQYLNTICLNSSTSTESFLRLIFSSLRDALNLRTDSYENYFTFFPSKDDDGYLTLLVEKCRQKVLLLPSYDIVRDHLSAFLALYTDLQITKFSSDDNAKEVNLMNWSSAHGQKYPELSNWEFCMAIDSPLNIEFLLSLATIEDLTEQKTEAVQNAFFPWVCCIQKILEGYIYYNDDLTSGIINYDFYYENLKEYETRIVYFISKAVKSRTASEGYINKIVKLLLGIYTTHPKACEGMNRITSKALLKAGGSGMFFYTAAINLLRARKYF